VEAPAVGVAELYSAHGRLAEALLGSLTGDPESYCQLAPGVPETAGGSHGAGQLLLSSFELP